MKDCDAPLSRPKGPRSYPDRGNARGAKVFLSKLYTVNYVIQFTTAPRVTIVTTVATAAIVSSVTTIGISIPNTTGHIRLL